jgi:predicted ATPase/class 3 adenylate cyclase/Tfp pilus assembly protein PilF
MLPRLYVPHNRCHRIGLRIMAVHALLFSDVVDSTRLVERLGDARAAEAWAAHDRRARDLLPRHKGREIGRADGFFLLFNSARDAAAFALDYHRALADLAMAVRVGIHVGPVILRENTPADIARGAIATEVEGLATPIAARIMGLARGGTTLLSGAAREALGQGLGADAEVRHQGWYRLKGIEQPVEIFELGIRNACSFTPPVDVDKAYRVARAGDLWLPVRQIRHSLPAERDGFVGRAVELAAISARLDAGSRLLTVLGPGGTGKTRFVRRYGWAWLGEWPGGVYFCDLSDARSLDGVFGAVATALDVPLGREDPAVQLGHAIAGRGRCLVILDNFEQVVQHAATTVGLWLDRARGAAFIVTSRERLQLQGEEVFPLEPLPVEGDAIELFAQRARAQRPDFALSESNRAAVAEVVHLLDGLPLAIELAAARARLLTPAQLVERMRDRFRLLAGARGMAARQATLRAAIDWSWELLTPWEQAALAQCSVFEGGFTLNAAEAVLDLARWSEAPPVMDVVQALSDKSLLRTWFQHGRYDIDEPFFGMYISIHEYAATKLQAEGPAAVSKAEVRHGRHFAELGTDDAIEALSRSGGVRLRHALALELDNLVAAIRRAAQRGDGEVAVAAYRACWEVLELQGPYRLGIELGQLVLANEALDSSQRAGALLAYAGSLRRYGRTKDAGSALEQALAFAREARNRLYEADIIAWLGNLRRDQGLMQDAQANLEAALAIAREVGNRRLEGNLLGNLGNLNAEQGRFDAARALHEQALAIHREVGNRRIEGIDTSNLGNDYRDQGVLEEAGVQYERALAIDREVANRRDEGVVIANLGVLRRDQGRVEEAGALCEAALAIASELGDRRLEGYLLNVQGNVLQDQGRTDEALVLYRQALVIHRAVGNRRSEGTVLGNLGEILTAQGRFEEALASFAEAESTLREVGDQLGLAAVLCDRALAEAATGNIGAARAAMASAEAAALSMRAGPDSEVGRRLSTLRAKLA